MKRLLFVGRGFLEVGPDDRADPAVPTRDTPESVGLLPT
jgi:hypothetical protein